MLAEEFIVLDADSPLWNAVRPFVEAALQIERNDDTYAWHGWRKKPIEAFLQGLPEHCSLLVGVWQEDNAQALHETLTQGFICEVKAGQVHSLRTFGSLVDKHVPPIEQLEPGYQHALELMRAARIEVAPVAWAIFTDKATWDTWLLDEPESGAETDKGALLSTLARQGRCVLMGSQTAHNQKEKK